MDATTQRPGKRGLTRAELLDYFLSSCTPRDGWLVGMEYEKMGVAADNGRRIPYDGARASVRSFLEAYLDRRPGDPVFEGDNLIGVDGPWGTITLEPGGQVEWSSRPRPTLEALGADLAEHNRAMHEGGEALGIRWLDEALDPDTALADVPWMPKSRYKILAPYLGKRGRLAHRMMTQTASIQCAFDFDSPEDWARKFRAAALLSPIAVALFANSSRIDGADTGYACYRQAIWRETDDDRCGLPPVVFDPGFGMEHWLDWVIATPTIFRHCGRGLAPAGGVPFAEILARTGCAAPLLEDWELHLSSIFTEVRSYRYLEVRCADLQPEETILAVPALWTTAFYDEENLDAVLAGVASIEDYPAWRRAMDDAARRGLDADAGGRSFREWSEAWLGRALVTLQRGGTGIGDPAPSIAAIERLAERLRLTPRES